jgi:energy-coupling factor transporter ATP-binding protein EcfA2
VARADIIDSILSRRAQRVEDLSALERVAAELDLALVDMNSVRLVLCDKVDGDAHAGLLGMGVLIDDIRRNVAGLQRDISRTASRFSRRVLSIGAIGRSGQGKSTFLQSLTGLSSREIPAAKGGFMTGVPSQIRHGPGPTIAEVEFYDEASFLEEVLRPYYSTLRLEPVPASLDAFGTVPIPELPEESGSTREASAYEHLRSYREYLPDYREFLREPARVRGVSPEEIVRFVAQYDETGRRIHAFRAVRRVRITTKFGQPDLGRVSVVDLPGLGDTNLRDEYLLRQAIDGEVDVVLFVRRPDPFRDDVHDVDVALYDIARSAMPELALERWSFLLLNRVETQEGGNSPMVDRFPEIVRRSKIRVVDVLDADCTDRDQVNTAFDKVVDHAVRVIDELDQSLLERRRQELLVILGEVGRFVAEAEALSSRAAPRGAWFLRFQQLFNEAHEGLSRALERLVRDYAADVTATDEELSQQIQVTVETAREVVIPPTIEEVNNLRDQRGSYKAALAELIDLTRAQISRQFLRLDGALKARVEAMHTDLAGVLRTAGQLGGAWPESGRDFLLKLADQADEALTGSVELSDGLRFVADFTLSYRGFIQHRIRRALKKLDPDDPLFHRDSEPVYIEYILEELIPEILYDIETELQSMTHESHEAVFAVTEEFRDRVLRARGAEDAWEAVYMALRSEIWVGEFEALAANTSLFNQWNKALTTLAALARTAA